MKKLAKSSLSLLLAIIMMISAATMLFSCENDGEKDDTEAPVSNGDVEVTDQPVVEGEFKFTEEVKIARPDAADSTVKEACILIAQAILDTYGIRVRVISDWNDATGPEIIVGECTHRDVAMTFTNGFYKGGYGYKVLSDSQLVVSAMTSKNVYKAAELFVEEVIKKGGIPEVKAGVELIKNNEKPKVDFSINGVKLEEYTIVADSADNESALWLCEQIKRQLSTDLTVVSAKEFKGGHAIKIGHYGCNCYYGRRYRVMSENVGGVSTVYLDADSDLLLKLAAEFLYNTYLETSFSKADFEIPKMVYGYRWGPALQNTGLYFNEIVEKKELAEGVDYYQMKYCNKDGKNVDAFFTIVSGDSKAEFRVWAGDLSSIDEGKEKMTVKTVNAQARELQAATGETVIAATNAAYFLMGEGSNYPWTIRIIQGKELCPPRETGNLTRPANWIGITYDGQLVTGNRESYYSTWKDKLEYAVACGIYMMKDGKVQFQDNQNISINPLTVVATTADGGFVLLCVDGRPENGNGTSAGGTSADMLGIILDLEMLYPDIKFVDVYTMDGGGSTEMILRNKAGTGFTTVNDPCDVKSGRRGNSRKVGDIIAVVIPD